MRTILLLISLAVFGSANAQSELQFFFNDDVPGERTTVVMDGDNFTMTIDVYSVGYELTFVGSVVDTMDGTRDLLLVDTKGDVVIRMYYQYNGVYNYTDGDTVQTLKSH